MSVSATEMNVRPRRIVIYRHSVLTRITHWINVLCILVLVMSGLQIFNAHPSLYFGQQSDFANPALSMRAVAGPDGKPMGVTRIGEFSFDTTGFLGLSAGANGEPRARGFPSWLTLPSYQDLATGRRWHFFFAWLFVINGAVYVIASLINGHVWRDLLPTGRQLRQIGKTIVDHIKLHFGHGDEARHYNVLQKLVYLAVIFLVLPLLILAGLAMSPAVDAALPWLVPALGGRQTARTIHFICASLIVLFVFVHVVMVLISGVWNNIRSMVTGRYAIATEPGAPGEKP